MIFKVAFAVLASAFISGKDNGHAFGVDLGNKKGSDKVAVKDIISYHQKQVTPASSAYSNVKQSNRFLRLRKTLWYRDEPNKLVNIEESKEHSIDAQECVDPVKLSAKEKLDAGHLPLSTCPSKDEVCVKNENEESSASSTAPSSSGPEQKTGVCVPINEVPLSYWDIRDPNGFVNDLPMSYWNDYLAGDVGAVSFETEIDNIPMLGLGKVQQSFLAGVEYPSFGVSATSDTTASYYSESSSTDSSLNAFRIIGNTFALFPTTNHGKGYSTASTAATTTVPAIVSTNNAYQGNQKIDTNRQLQSQYCSDFVTETCGGYRPEIQQNGRKFKNLIRDCVNYNECDRKFFGPYSDYNYPSTPIGCWDTSRVTDMYSAFYEKSNFNKPINCWDVSRVISMSSMFRGANNFNQPIQDWNVSSLNTMYAMFRGANNFNQPIQDWNVSQVSFMNSLFRDATSFNQPIQDWNVSQVTFMTSMFRVANNFNQPIQDWNVSRVTHMFSMFRDAINFNQCLGSWAFKTGSGPNVLTNMLLNTKCSDGYSATPNKTVGPWCQGPADGCTGDGLIEPSNAPTFSSAPSSDPSEEPSLSVNPSSESSVSPSTSALPSIQPSGEPSASIFPSGLPSSVPSLSSVPSNKPSDKPSLSAKPSSLPSAEPSLSSNPSSKLSNKPSLSSGPSKLPSDKPSLSVNPSYEPSDAPSFSSGPSNFRTEEPSSSVTIPSKQVCKDNPDFKFVFVNRKGDKTIKGDCGFVAKKRKERCRKTMPNGRKVRKECPATCKVSTCTCKDSTGFFRVKRNGKPFRIQCKNVSPSKNCDIGKIINKCPVSCGVSKCA